MQTEKELRQRVIANFTVPEFRSVCLYCSRGAVELPLPSQEDLEALYELVEGYDRIRRSFTPAEEQRIARGKYILGYLNSMRAGLPHA